MEASNSALPSKITVERIILLSSLLRSLILEMKEFAKKKQDGVLNKLKVKLINKVLTEIKNRLAGEPTAEFLEILDEDSLPQNSDAVLILGQFGRAIIQFRNKYYISHKTHGLIWNTSDGLFKDTDVIYIIPDEKQ